MGEAHYTTGQAAKELGTSSYNVRRLCEAGIIQSELTAGGHWRIPASAVAKLKRDGIPPIPQVLREDAETDRSRNGHEGYDRPTEGRREPHHQPSCELIASAESVEITANELKRRKIELERQDVEDQFREHERQRQSERAADEQREAEAAAQVQHQRWFERWMSCGLDSLPDGAPDELRLVVYESVEGALAKIAPGLSDFVVRRVVEAAREKALRPWRRGHAIEGIIDEVGRRLSRSATYPFSHEEWVLKVQDLATRGIRELPADATLIEIEVVATQAAKEIARQLDYLQSCRTVIDSVWSCLPGSTYNEREEAKEVVANALAGRLSGSERELRQIRDEVLIPITQRIAERKLKS